MSEINDGGPAFPQPIAGCNDGGVYEVREKNKDAGGMTLRDWFAGQADVPWNAVLETLALKGESKPTVQRVCEYRAQMNYWEADAMLAARSANNRKETQLP